MAKAVLIVLGVCAFGALMWLLASLSIEDEKKWQAFKSEHRCVQTGERRGRLISAKPIMFKTEHLWKCDNGSYWH